MARIPTGADPRARDAVQMSKSKVYLLLAAVAVYFGWHGLSRSSYETVILHIPPSSRSEDVYVNLWVVDDGNTVWIRAESPQRVWLDYLRDDPIVELERSGRQYRYRAVPQDDAGTRAYVDGIFRAKYGIADEVRALFRSRTVPIRLERP